MRPHHILYLLLLSITSCQDTAQKPTLLITNAVIWTANPAQPYTQAMAVADDKILAIGTREDMREYAPAREVDAEGRFIVPGFIDSHVHLMTGGRSLLSVDLRDAASREEFARRVGAFAETMQAGEWMLEGNWDHTLWDGELPHRDWVDAVTKDTPVGRIENS